MNFLKQVKLIVFNNREYFYLTLIGFVSSYIINRLMKRGKLELKEDETNKKIKVDLNIENEKELLAEQLKRNYEFFSNEQMEKIMNAKVCVIGLGGVGSHAVMTLIRSGIQNLKVIDYDIVTLSSLNRHAFALREDVGKLKSTVVKEYTKKIFPLTNIISIEDAITLETLEKYLSDEDYIIDCIDDLENKCYLIHYCIKNHKKIISSMGAGAKMNPFLTRYCDFTEIKGDKIAKRLRYLYKKKFNENINEGAVKSVFSLEVPTRGLTDMADHQKENIKDYLINTNERVRTLPVFASIPAIFGQSLAAITLCELAGENMFATYSEEKEKQEKEEDMIGEYSIKNLILELKQDLKLDNIE